MRVALTKSFLKDATGLSVDGKAALFDVILKLPAAIKDPLRHDGAGLRKIHSTGIFEARIGLSLRIVFGYHDDELVLHRVGDHDEIRRYLKTL